ncbi:MAG: conjugative transfer system coupling protein TraD [Salinisphaeraceae bacterium]
MKLSIDLPWRSAFEAYSATAWLAGAAACALYGLSSPAHYTTALWMMVVCTGFAAFRGSQAIGLWERKVMLRPESLTFMKPEQLSKLVKKFPDRCWMGRGFDWRQEHAQLAFEVRKSKIVHLKPPALYAWLRGARAKRNEHGHVPSSIGSLWIHGLNREEGDVLVPLDHLQGHTLLVGTTGSGKTRAFETLVTQAVMRGECVIMVDPKGDKDARKTMQRACILAGRPDAFMHFHPAFPERSVRIDPLHNWNRPTEIASRIATLIPSESGSDAFVAFSWRVINLIVQAMVLVSERPNLKILRRHIEGGPDALLHRVLESYYERFVPGWRSRIQAYKQQAAKMRLPSASSSKDTMALVLMYKNEVIHQSPHEAIGGLISYFDHSREHASKMLASLMPTLDMLTSGDLGDLLSPDPDDHNDPRPMTDSAKVIQEGQVLYIGTDSLSDGTVGAAIASIILADITSVAGDRYNYGIDNRTVALFIDEASEVLSNPTVQLMNKGRGAGFVLTVATQTYPDFVARMGNEAKARQILGNLNNTIALRTLDGNTQEYLTESMGTSSLMTLMHTQNTNSVAQGRDPTNFVGGYGERLIEKDDADLVPSELLGSLPNFHYIATLSGGKIVKGRFPILQSKIDPELEDMPWLQKHSTPADNPATTQTQTPDARTLSPAA